VKTVTQKEYARRRNVTPQYVNKLVRSGRIPLEKDGRINPARADRAREGYRRVSRRSKAEDAEAREQVGGRRARGPELFGDPESRPGIHSATASLTSIRAAHESYKAKLAKLEYERAIGKLLERDQVLAAERLKNERIRSAFRALPRSLAPVLARCATAAEAEVLLREELDRVLLRLAEDPLGMQETAALAVAPATELAPAVVQTPALESEAHA
jgi:hypothetical protein